jgi:hypothetical protein
MAQELRTYTVVIQLDDEARDRHQLSASEATIFETLQAATPMGASLVALRTYRKLYGNNIHTAAVFVGTPIYI